MYYTNWVEPENYSTRDFFNKYEAQTRLNFSAKYAFLQFNRNIRDQVRCLVNFSDDKIGVMFGINLDDPFFLESLFFRWQLSNGKFAQVEVNIKKTTLFNIIEQYVYEGEQYTKVERLLYGRLQHVWKVLFRIALDNCKEIPQEDKTQVKTWLHMC